ncbi:hypothetical protein CQ14_03035 [Bradyrhizobium lablabi]|uniref:Uncharacterized protein n=1 Tax=Bradyrhizobium lablabi TaxID=722472 RepID=A0A0R3N3D0_9BRAD|nr:hypothetical protein [Bradyrhizobium lablabi]KRR26476.1 hypothetical protein CQ14_03035 [Bradyrhizobium lablabi]
MTNSEIAEIDAAIVSLRAVIDAAEQTLARLIAQRPARYIAPSQATGIDGRSESQIRRDCEANPVDRGGFGLKVNGRWLVDEHIYRLMRGRLL